MVKWKRWDVCEGEAMAQRPALRHVGKQVRSLGVTMANEALRDMAAHRGFKLISSRRRKPGGDFGLYGLKGADGEPVFGIEKGALKASADEIEAFLRDGMRATWTKSAGSVKRVKTPPPPKVPKLKPKPCFKPKVANLLAKLPPA